MTPFVKRYPTPAQAVEALRRSAILSVCGLDTPWAKPGEDDRSLEFQRIDGATRFELLDAAPMREVLAPIRRLHLCPFTGLAAFDPFLRIDPRLPGAPGRTLRMVERLRARVAPGKALIHGDLHVGQLIRDDRGTVWILDLDDLAVGPPEADLANLVAHLATSPETGGATIERGVARWRDTVCGAWHELGATCDPGVFATHLAIALIRRHLKLREAGRPDHAEAIGRFLSVA